MRSSATVALCILLLAGCAQVSPWASEEYVDETADAIVAGLPADQSEQITADLAEIRAHQDGLASEGVDLGLLIAQLVGGGGLGAILVRLLRGAPLASGSGRRKKAAEEAARKVDTENQSVAA